MRMQSKGSWFLCALLLATTGGCESAAPTDGAEVRIPLVQPGAGGTIYRLRDASFHVTGPGGVDLLLVAPDDAPDVQVTLSPGLHNIELLPGWSLERSADGVTFEPLPGVVLASVNPGSIRVRPNLTQTMTFEFILRSATSDVHITFGVVEQPLQLGGTIRWQSAPNVEFAAYVGTTVDVALFYEPLTQTLAVEADGTHARTVDSVVNAIDVFNDGPGLLGPLFGQLAGGYVIYTVRMPADQVGLPEPLGTFEGTYDSLVGGPVVNLTFVPGSQVFFLELDADGFPVASNFSVINQTVELYRDGELVLRGRFQGLRHIAN